MTVLMKSNSGFEKELTGLERIKKLVLVIHTNLNWIILMNICVICRDVRQQFDKMSELLFLKKSQLFCSLLDSQLSWNSGQFWPILVPEYDSEDELKSGTSIASEDESSSDELKNNAEGDGIRKACHNCCPACDRAFFPSLLDEMAAVVCCFNARAKQLLELHLASGFRKYLVWMRSRVAGDHLAMIQEGRNLVNYASINAIAIRKILKKYDKVHYSKKGRAFRTRAQAMQMEILQSPWLNELIAFSINLMNANNSATFVSDFGDCSLTFEGGKPSLSCTLLDSVKLDIDLTCSICLVSSLILFRT